MTRYSFFSVAISCFLVKFIYIIGISTVGDFMIHQTAEVNKEAKIGKNCKIWHLSQIREMAVLGMKMGA